jgi:hypothetical protein
MNVKHDSIDHPAHYTFSAIEPIDVIEAWQLGFHLGNVLKYLARAGRKGSRIDDLKKARWYLDREIKRLEQDEADEDLEPGKAVCPECNGVGTSRLSNRPDDLRTSPNLSHLPGDRPRRTRQPRLMLTLRPTSSRPSTRSTATCGSTMTTRSSSFQQRG